MAPAEVSSRRVVVHADGERIKMEYVLRGDPSAQPVVLFVSGLGSQLTEWPDDMISAVEAAGYATLRYDNRDCGLSTMLEHLTPASEVTNALKERVGMHIEPVYTLEAMASDALLLLDALSINRVHMIGQSMGGMIAQILLTSYPERIRSATFIMSCPGPGNGPHLPSLPWYLQYAYKARTVSQTQKEPTSTARFDIRHNPKQSKAKQSARPLPSLVIISTFSFLTLDL